MKRKYKLIISITIIIAVLIIIIGSAYAYYVFKIQGNTKSSTSVSDTLANLVIEFEDDYNYISVKDIEPSDTTTYVKEFSLLNSGGNDIPGYAIIFDVKENTFEANSGLVFSIEAHDPGDKRTYRSITEENFPTTIGENVVLTNFIPKNTRQYYTVTLKYKNLADYDQSVNSGKHVFATIKVVDIRDVKQIDDEDTLAYNIYYNSSNVTNGTSLAASAKTYPAGPASLSDEKNLISILDDFGTSYYFRGNVTDNYVNFAGMCWKVVRIQGDKSIKLILEDQDQVCQKSNGNWNIPAPSGSTVGNFGYARYSTGNYYASYLNPTDESSTGIDSNYSMVNAFKKFQTERLASYLYMLSPGNWCYDDRGYLSISADILNDEPLTAAEKTAIIDGSDPDNSSFNYAANIRIGRNAPTRNPSLICNGEILSTYADGSTLMYVGTITGDEATFAGASSVYSNSDFYLLNNYQKNNNLIFYTLSLAQFGSHTDLVYSLDTDGTLNRYTVRDNQSRIISFRPSVVLNSGTKITKGVGTKANPYVVKVTG